MGLQTSFRVLSRIVERQESHGRPVGRVETRSEADGEILHVTLDVPISLCAASGDGLHPDLSPDAMVTDDGGFRVEFSPSVLSLPSTTAAAISVSKEAARVTDDGLCLTVELTIDPTESETRPLAAEDGRTGDDSAEVLEPTTDESSDGTDGSVAPSQTNSGTEAEPATLLEMARNEELPLYEDIKYLKRLYDSCDTFQEMSQNVETDVSSETVRRYMIQADIHEPTSYDTATAGDRADEHSTDGAAAAEPKAAEPLSAQSSPSADDAEETDLNDNLITDGLGLPQDIQITDVVDAVVDSSTVYEVQQHLDLGQQRTRGLLEQLNLLDLVMHRVSDDPKRDMSFEEVAARVRQCTSTGT